MRKIFVLSICVFFVLPFEAAAAVVLNEVAWMGTDEGGASCEWIELVNTDSLAESLVGYTITIENVGSASAPKVIDVLEAASLKDKSVNGIAGNGFFLLARNSGSCGTGEPGTSADWVGSFGNGISNDGAKLILKQNGSVKDTVDASPGWTQSGIGGKNTSGQPKQTPQRSGTSWITALPTPRGATVEAEEPLDEDEQENEGATTTVTVAGSVIQTAPSPHLLPKLYIAAGPNRIVTAGADTAYRAAVYDKDGKYRAHADITWTFGDGAKEKGKEVMHAYDERGTYLAVVRAKYGSAVALHTITVDVVPAQVRVLSVSDRGIEVENESDRMLDLSGWKLISATSTFTMPEDTVLREHGSVLFSSRVTHLPFSQEVALHYPDGVVAAAYAPASITTPDQPIDAIPTPAPPPPDSFSYRRPPLLLSSLLRLPLAQNLPIALF